MQKRCKGLLVLLDNKNKRTKKIIKWTGRVILNVRIMDLCPIDCVKSEEGRICYRSNTTVCSEYNIITPHQFNSLL